MRLGNAVGVGRSTFEQASLLILQLIYGSLQRAREQAAVPMHLRGVQFGGRG
jgi:hypothetical protein